MKILIIRSSHSEVPLAEIRTDGRIIDFVVDNTNGKLPRLVGKDLSSLKKLVARSSHLSIEDTSGPTVNFLRYLLNNGDVVEVTTDGRTALLNGKLLSEEEKQAIFEAVRRGDLKVERKADPSKPIPVMPTPKIKTPQINESDTFRSQIIQEIEEMNRKKAEMNSINSKDYDAEIETMDLRGAEDPEYIKKLMYRLKYGES